MASINPPPPIAAPADALSTAPTRPMPSGESLAGRRSRFPWGLALGALVLVALIAGGAWWLMSRGSSSGTREGLVLLSQNKREVARDVFKKAARDDPRDALPLVYLGRMFRDEQRYDSATAYLQAAIRRDPKSAPAYREMAKLLFIEGNYDLARTFFIRAITVDKTDRESMGYLGCTLMRLGRAPDAQSWLQRAGQGAWSGCAAGAPMPGTLPPA
jgi:tetratricopeptide (TPR) repeat protein